MAELMRLIYIIWVLLLEEKMPLSCSLLHEKTKKGYPDQRQDRFYYTFCCITIVMIVNIFLSL